MIGLTQLYITTEPLQSPEKQEMKVHHQKPDSSYYSSSSIFLMGALDPEWNTF